MKTEYNAFPELLKAHAGQGWQRLTQRAPELVESLQPYRDQLLAAFAMSDFICDSCVMYPQMALELVSSGDLEMADRAKRFSSSLEQMIAQVSDETELYRSLRYYRRYQMCVIAWRELLGKSDVRESLNYVSLMALHLLEVTMEWLYQKQCLAMGTPMDSAGNPQRMLILTMGKLGGCELNFSSDIDLIFTFAENGKTQGATRSVSNQEFFIRLGQKLVQALNKSTADGFVYRVDMRLRPFGSAGPLVVSFAALEDYYQRQGREWERFAMVKAGILGGSAESRQQLHDLLRPFIYRRYVDFGAIDSLRCMKGMINAEIRRKGLKDNIKLGAGGIREVEFIVQAFQLIRGGRLPELQIRNLLATIEQIDKLELLPQDSCERLSDAYLFLRQVENRLQQFGDKQTQELPTDQLNRVRLVFSMGFDEWDPFYQQLYSHMHAVHHEFMSAIGKPEESSSSQCEPVYQDLWLASDLEQFLPAFLQERGLQLESLSSLVLNFKQEMERRPVGPRGRASLDRLIPELFQLAFAKEEPERLLTRLFHLIGAIATRTPYIELLVENPGALHQLITLLDGSAFITEQLAAYPLLLDELLDPQHLYHPVDPNLYGSELLQFMLRIDPDDLEQQMEGLRQFKQLQMLRIAAADVAGVLPLMKVSDHLTAVAEAILSYSVELAWRQMTERYGVPLWEESERRDSDYRGFAVIGYGKMGGIELSYSSDLDLVFLHNSASHLQTSGPKVLSCREFYQRLAQRLMHLFNTRTSSGILYELDLRLRPSGASGLMVASMQAFESYQNNEAWTWEHQALVRARCCYGSPDMESDFYQIRKNVLMVQRDRQHLQEEIVKMRLKMRNHLLRGAGSCFDLKQSSGGMVDIEFIAQYLVLAYSCQYPQLCRYSDNIRIFEQALHAGLISESDAKLLIDAYIAIRDESNRLTMQRQSRLVEAESFQKREQVQRIWQQLLEEND